MNFLAHLHLAHLADSSLPGNLMADFVRGNPQGDYPAAIVDGIYMHRRIDVLTDNLAEVKEAREWFRPQTRRVAPITLDVMWDHFLSQHWAQLSPDLPLDEFVRYAERQIVPILPTRRPASSISINTSGRSAGWSATRRWILFSACSMAWPAAARVSRRCATPGRIWILTTTGWRGSSGAFIRR